MIQTSREKVAYLDTRGSGFPVFLVHGNSCSSEVFKKQIAVFGNKYRLIAVDLPGHGKSPNAVYPETAYTIPGYAELLNEIAVHLGIERFAVVGYSLGGNIALQWSQISDRIAGIMMIASAPMKYSLEAFEAYPKQEDAYGGSPEMLTEEQARGWMRLVGVNVDDPETQFMIRDAMRTDAQARATMVASVLNGKGFDETEIVKTLDVPLTIVIGKEDQALGIEYIKRLRSDVIELPETGHAICLHQANLLHPFLLSFLKDIED
ncbi:MAG: alpha/beta hydrolase [Parachlamydiales bacterium]|nr:alpha/beta hydrolase [Parachlamydiales bacterium]